jgi:hypothetical protein
MSTLQLLGTIGGLLFLACIVAAVGMALLAMVYGYIATRTGERLNQLEAMSGGRKRDEQ